MVLLLLPSFVLPSAVLVNPSLIVLAIETKMSPFGATYIHLGLSKPSVNFVTVNPAGAVGALPSGHPITLELFLVEGVAKGAGRGILSGR